jgi:hypothetical protein
MADKQESKVTCCGIEFRDSEKWVDHLLSKADHYDPLFPEGRKCPGDHPAPSSEAMKAAREIVRQQQIYDRGSFVMMTSEVAEIIDAQFAPLRRQIAALNEALMAEAAKLLSPTATEKTEAEK